MFAFSFKQPESFAEPYIPEMSVPVEVSKRIFGQRVWGDDMIPQQQVVRVHPNVDDDEDVDHYSISPASHHKSVFSRLLSVPKFLVKDVPTKVVKEVPAFWNDNMPHEIDEVPLVGFAAERIARWEPFGGGTKRQLVDAQAQQQSPETNTSVVPWSGSGAAQDDPTSKRFREYPDFRASF